MNKPKRILHFQGRMGKGGAETFMMNAFREINRKEYVFDFVIYEDFQDVQPYHEEIKELGGHIYVVPNPNKNIIRYIREVKKLFQTHHFDIVHNEIFFGGGINLWLAKQANISQRIAHSHATTDGKGNQIPYGLIRPVFHKMLMNNATDFLACSHEAGIGLFGDTQPFITVPNGIDLNQYRFIPETKEKLHEELSLPADSFVIGHIGRFEEQKNHRFLMKIMKELIKTHPNTYLLSIGTGSLEEEIHQLADQLDIKEHILFLEERNDIPELMKMMDVFLLPSLYEGLPMVAVEAQAANIKVVLSNEVSRDTILSKNIHFISLEDSLTEWEEVIFKLPLGNEPLPKLEEFDRKNTAMMLEEIYI